MTWHYSLLARLLRSCQLDPIEDGAAASFFSVTWQSADLPRIVFAIATFLALKTAFEINDPFMPRPKLSQVGRVYQPHVTTFPARHLQNVPGSQIFNTNRIFRPDGVGHQLITLARDLSPMMGMFWFCSHGSIITRSKHVKQLS